MKKIKLITTLSAGLMALSPLVIATSCNKPTTPEITENVVWHTHTKLSEVGETQLTYYYSCKEVSDNDEITVSIKEQTGTNIRIVEQTFDKQIKTGWVTFNMDVEDVFKQASTAFTVTISCKNGNVWTEDVANVTAVYMNASEEVPADSFLFSDGTIYGLKPLNTKYNHCKKLVIPNTIDGQKVTTIGPSAFKDECCATGSLPNVEQIVFDEKTNVTTIGESAFEGCSNVTKQLDIPPAITSIGKKAFYGTKISSLFIESDNNSLELGESCFESVPLTGDLSIPQKVTKIGYKAFNNCTLLNGILTLESQETELSDLAFGHCLNVKGFNFERFSALPETGKWTQRGTAEGCFEGVFAKAEEKLLLGPQTLLDNLKTLIKNCQSAAKIQLKTDITTSATDFNYDETNDLITGIKTDSLGNKKILYFPEFYKDTSSNVKAVKGIKAGAFANIATTAPQLKSVYFSATTQMTSIGDNAFKGAKFTDQYTEVGGLYIPNTITTIGNSAFEGASFGEISLTNPCTLYLSNKVTTIGSKAFNCPICLPKSFIPETLTNVGAEAFSDCYLKDNEVIFSIALQGSSASVGDKAFAFADASSIFDFTEGPTINFTNFWLEPKWTGTEVFGSSSKLYDAGNVKIKVKDMVVYNPDKYNAWDQYEYLVYFKTFVTTNGGLDANKLDFDPSFSKYPKSLFTTFTSSTPITFLTGFARYGSNGQVIDSENLDLFAIKKTYGGNEVKLIKLETLTPYTKITEEALAYTEGEQCINFGDKNIEAVLIPNTVTDINNNFLSGQTSIKYIDMSTWTADKFEKLKPFTDNTFSGLNSTDTCYICLNAEYFDQGPADYMVSRLKELCGLPSNWSALLI